MNKTQLIASASETSGLSIAQIHEALTAITDTVGEEMSKGNNVLISSFGKFYPVPCGRKLFYNPTTKEKEVLDPTTYARFQPSPSLKKSVLGS